MQQRLQKLIAQAGIASRRHAEDLIAAGQVTVNGAIVATLGAKADPERDAVKVRGKLINPALVGRSKVYLLLNKPRGYLTSNSDPEGRPLVTDLLPRRFGKLHPVGRLDFNSEGLLLLTNDGELTHTIISARSRIEKVYEVKVKGVPPERAVERLRQGISIGNGERTAPAQIHKLRESKTNSWFEVILREGRNQQIRRMFAAVGHSVMKLRRVRIGTLTDKRSKPGEWRLLTDAEVKLLKRAKSKERRKFRH